MNLIAVLNFLVYWNEIQGLSLYSYWIETEYVLFVLFCLEFIWECTKPNHQTFSEKLLSFDRFVDSINISETIYFMVYDFKVEHKAVLCLNIFRAIRVERFLS